MFEASAPFLFFDYFRIPYRVSVAAGELAAAPPISAWERFHWPGDERVIHWPRFEPGAEAPPEHRLGSIPLFCRVVPDTRVRGLLGEGWSPADPVEDAEGNRAASIWRADDGSVLLPFDPAEAIMSYWSESYGRAPRASAAGRAKQAAMWGYYRVRPLLPRRAQIAMRRVFSRIQARTRFPRWPLETALHDLYDALFGLVAGVAPEPVPWLHPWPAGRSWALVLTHDVETSVGYEHIDLLKGIEAAAGHRSSWNLVPRRYDVADDVVHALQEEGFEVGVHGLYHDGRDLESLATLQERLPAIREYAERWGAVGFRSPATHRDWELMPLLGFDYDSSSPDTDPFEPQSGGCCSLLPYFNGDLVELPVTLPQDHTLFVILRRDDEQAWVEKAHAVRDLGGMALLITHPDYMLEPSSLEIYRRFLAAFAGDDELWKPLPREVSAWWRRRAASSIERADGEWTVVGPAAGEAAIAFATASG
jgi:hypothetical protein